MPTTFYVNGWIDKVKFVHVVQLEESHYLITSAVRHSEKLSAAPAKPWVGVRPNETIIFDHWSCMAGCGEVCSHIAA